MHESTEEEFSRLIIIELERPKMNAIRVSKNEMREGIAVMAPF